MPQCGLSAISLPMQNHAMGATRYFPVSLEAGFASYGNCLIAEADAERLTLKPMLLIQPFHPPFTLPRSEVTNVQTGSFWFIRWVSFWVDERPLRLYGRIVTSEFWGVADR